MGLPEGVRKKSRKKMDIPCGPQKYGFRTGGVEKIKKSSVSENVPKMTPEMHPKATQNCCKWCPKRSPENDVNKDPPNDAPRAPKLTTRSTRNRSKVAPGEACWALDGLLGARELPRVGYPPKKELQKRLQFVEKKLL